MPDGGKLTVEAVNVLADEDYCRLNPELSPGQYVIVCVTDTGTGMTADVVNHAFEPFFTTKVPGQGTGLGLSQVYGFVKQSGGHVKIYSEVGQGTTIKVYLPRSRQHTEQASQIERRIVGSKGNETVMIVEDDPDVRSYLVETLEGLNYQVREA